MYIRNKPEKPVRISKKNEVLELFDGITLQEMVDFAAYWEVDFDRVKFDVGEQKWFDGAAEPFLRFSREETDGEFDKRMKTYNKKMDAYNAWKKENQEEIQAYYKEQIEQEEKKTEEKKRKLQEQIDKLS